MSCRPDYVIVNGRYCGRRVAVLYGAGEWFACRRCYDLAYASQQQSRMERNVSQLGGSPDVLEPLPERPGGMHRRTYLRLRARAETAEQERKDALTSVAGSGAF